MCTVSFIPAGDWIFLTHNRDEKSSRSSALAPREHSINGCRLIFPRDSAAGGSWIACNEYGHAAVLLNGAFTKHRHEPPYSRSRGLAFLEIVAAANLLQAYRQADLQGVEPFTVICWSHQQLHECRWDGHYKHVQELDAVKAHTWSSVTLYDEENIAKRAGWFTAWQEQHPLPNMEDIIAYHLHAGEGDPENDLRMNRQGNMLTVSITALELSKEQVSMVYLDLSAGTRQSSLFTFTKAGVLQ
jgi:Transport and Golgi organisation 2